MEASSRSGLRRLSRLSRQTDGRSRGLPALPGIAVLVALAVLSPCVSKGADGVAKRFEEHIQPILEDYCYGCHGDGMKKGGVALDGFASAQERLRDPALWWPVLRNVRAGIMPPAGEARPPEKEKRLLADWIKFSAFGIDPDNPDPGRVTVRRLNRIEYRNTIRDLMGIDYDTTSRFPPDDTGHGFDNIGDVLTLSPLLLEKYLEAAKSIVAQSVPTSSRTVAEQTIAARRFRPAATTSGAGSQDGAGPLVLSYYERASVSTPFDAEHAGHYGFVLDLTANERQMDDVVDRNKCRLIFKVDGQELLRRDFNRQEGIPFRFECEQEWKAGPHELRIEVEPLTPGEKQTRSLRLQILSVTVRGPIDDQRYWVRPPNYGRFFYRDVPASPADRAQYARELLSRFATKAFRRPVPRETAERLAALAEGIAAEKGETFESSIARAMTAVLASPRFLFREEEAERGSPDRYPFIDQYALASRLSYFFWSTMPDDELFRLAGENKLRDNLSSEVKRLLADPRSAEFVRNFVGQWLQVRDIDLVLINAVSFMRDELRNPSPEVDRNRARSRELNRKPPEELTDKEKEELKKLRETFLQNTRRSREFELNRALRQAMRQESEMLFEYIVREDRSLAELVDCDYAFLNERLAKQYGIDGVKGEEMRKVALAPNSPRGGVLTQGTVLAVTSNPDRTSPVKRGLFILDNILGMPPPPPPADVPALEEAARKLAGKTPTLRETLALHRKEAMCSSCHNRMDPLGLALENLNGLGRWRDKERGTPIDSTGQLITGEKFSNVRELKHILANDHRRDFYRCLSEKMLTYALGRGLEFYDVHAVDGLVERIEKADGRASALIMGIVESTPFQRRRRTDAVQPVAIRAQNQTENQRAELRGRP